MKMSRQDFVPAIHKITRERWGLALNKKCSLMIRIPIYIPWLDICMLVTLPPCMIINWHWCKHSISNHLLVYTRWWYFVILHVYLKIWHYTNSQNNRSWTKRGLMSILQMCWGYLVYIGSSLLFVENFIYAMLDLTFTRTKVSPSWTLKYKVLYQQSKPWIYA